MDEARKHEILGILTAAATLLLGLALWSYDMRGGANWIGPVGSGLAGALLTAFGLGACVIPVELGLATWTLFRGDRARRGIVQAASMLVVVLVGCALLHLAMTSVTVFGGHLAGGVMGELVGEVLRSLFGLAGAVVVCVSLLLITMVLRTPLSVVSLARRGFQAALVSWRSAVEGGQQLVQAWREAKAIELAEREATRLREQPKIVPHKESAPTKKALAAVEATDEDEEKDEEDDGREDDANEDDTNEEHVAAESRDADLEDEQEETPTSQPKKSNAPRKRQQGPVIVAPRAEKTSGKQEPKDVIVPTIGKAFVLPPSSLLTEGDNSAIQIDEETLRENARLLVEKLAAYGVRGRVDEIHPGPVVTMYEFEPASGTKVSKIASLADDLAMALAAQKVRIVAPIPGKARVGFELPNAQRQTVYLRELLENDRWRALEPALPMAFGKDIAGQPVYGDMAKMPHLLVAGATGAGKSVGLNVMLASLLSKRTPEQVRFLMIDPKVVELAVFDGIPHMLLPVVTDMKKASLALRWAVDEMERRYQVFADAGARSITTYNEKVDKVLRGEMSVDRLAPTRAGKVKAKGPDGEEVLLNPDDEQPDAQQDPVRLPHIVVVVDEFADLMMVAAKDVETSIARLAQKARAAGIHVILATQRPSVDVITGMIKANFPSRIGYKVSQREDSKTILGRNGAEHLLGMGDMLMLMPGSSDLKRVHSAYIDEDEVRAICDFLRLQGAPVYDNEILKPRDDEDESGSGATGSAQDPLYDRAVAVVAQAGYCSISHIQRHLSIGYNKAANLVEQMETEGVVGPASGKAGGRREVFVEAR